MNKGPVNGAQEFPNVLPELTDEGRDGRGGDVRRRGRTIRERRKAMVKHIILWQLKDEFSEDRKKEIRRGIKEGLEGLAGKVPGLLEVHVRTEFLESSTADVMLDTTLESPEALKGYAVHPAHVAVADTKVRPYTKARVCMDYEVE